jgi:hypothetical protein
MYEEHRALITLLPFDVVITISAISILLLTFVSFVQRFYARVWKAPAVLGAGSGHFSQRRTI